MTFGSIVTRPNAQTHAHARPHDARTHPPPPHDDHPRCVARRDRAHGRARQPASESREAADRTETSRPESFGGTRAGPRGAPQGEPRMRDAVDAMIEDRRDTPRREVWTLVCAEESSSAGSLEQGGRVQERGGEGGHRDAAVGARKRLPVDEETCENAAKGGHLEMLKWGARKRLPVGRVHVRVRGEGGHLEVLQWARARNCRGDEETCAYAAEGGHLEVLQWARANNCPWNTRTCSGAAKGGHLDVLQWARERDCPWNVRTCSFAAEGGHLAVLKWARAQGCAWDELVRAFVRLYAATSRLQWAGARERPPMGQARRARARAEATPRGAAVGARERLPSGARSIRARRRAATSMLRARARLPVGQGDGARGEGLPPRGAEWRARTAARLGHLEVLQWARGGWRPCARGAAVVLQWAPATARGMRIRARARRRAATSRCCSGRARDCPWNQDTCARGRRRAATSRC